MTSRIDEDLLSRFSSVISERMGLSFPKERWTDLERAIQSAGVELGFREPESTIRWFLSSPPDKKHTEILASLLTVGETHFFRDARSFQALTEHLLPTLISSRRQDKRLRIWSAGCCTGEEPYSIAILLRSLLPDFSDWTITILATDINSRFLRKASEGIYTDWSFRDTPAWVRERYFKHRRDGRYEILPAIRDAVTFAPLNLIDDSYPSFLTNTNAIDLVLCRNVLMYFHPQPARQVVRKFFHALVDKGWLLVSPSEMSQTLFPEFESVHVSGALCYRKSAGQIHDIIPVAPSPGETPAAISEDGNRNPPDISMSFSFSSMESTIPEASNAEAAATEQISEPPEAQEVYRRARAEYENGAFAAAAERIRAALPTSPNEPSLVSLLARILASQGDLAEAEHHCRKAIEADKLNHAHRYLYAVIAREQGRDDEAIRSLQEALYLNPDSSLSHFLLASVFRRRGKEIEAGKHFRRALHLLEHCSPEQELPESDGMTAGRLTEIIQSIIQ